MVAFIYPNFSKKNAYEITEKVCSMMHNMGFSVLSDEELCERFPKTDYMFFGEINETIAKCDLIITIGGDGTILEASAYAAKFDIPLLGINTGRLGFMASMEKDELYNLSKLMSKDYKIENRMMLDCVHISEDGEKRYTALNDVVISGKYSRLSDFTVSANGTMLSAVRADGLIFSTPTGSTAYALSAGGPILEPELDCIQMTPICPQSLSSRTMIFSTDKVLEADHNCREKNSLYLNVDGVITGSVEYGDKVMISRSERCVKLIDISGNAFFNSVNSKLMNCLK